MRPARTLWSLIPQIHLLILLLVFLCWGVVNGSKLQNSVLGTPRHLRSWPCSFPCSEIFFFKSRRSNGQDNEGIRNREGVLITPSLTLSSPLQHQAAQAAAGGPYRAKKYLWRAIRQKKQWARLSKTRVSPLPTLPGTSPLVPWALLNTF